MGDIEALTQCFIKLVEDNGADWIHVDVMDGHFVPNITIGIPVVKALKRFARKPLDVHLMIVNPDKFINEIKALGTMMMNVHYEACTHLHRTIQNIHAADMKAGVTLNPHTPVSVLEDIINDVDMVLLMSVNPGFGGQKFIEHTFKKTKALKELIEKNNSKALIQIDGGVCMENASKLYEAGADCLVAGSAVFSSNDILKTIDDLKK